MPVDDANKPVINPVQRIDIYPRDEILGSMDLTLPKGEAMPFVAIATYQDGESADITALASWSSSEPTIASIAQGLASALAIGTTELTASWSDKTSQRISLTVTDALLERLELTPPTAQIAAGTEQAYEVIAHYSDQTAQVVTGQVSWEVSDPAVATISSNSFVNTATATGITRGETTLQAIKSGVKSNAVTLTVTDAQLRDLEITPTNGTIHKGMHLQYRATGVFSDQSTQDLTRLVTWRSSDPQIASVSPHPLQPGLVKGEMQGGARISASLGTLSRDTALNVSDALLNRIEITPPSATIPRGVVQDYIATGFYSDGSTVNLSRDVTWLSSQPEIARIHAAFHPLPGEEHKAKAKGVAVGETRISARFNGVSSGEAPLSVTEARLERIQLSPSNVEIPLGFTQSFTATGYFSDGQDYDLTRQSVWNMQNSADADIPMTLGLAYANEAGEFTVTASYAEKISPPSTLTVLPAQLQSISIAPSTLWIPNGLAERARAIGHYSDGKSRDISFLVDWSSSDPARIAIERKGSITMIRGHALTAAPVTLTAKWKFSDIAGTANVNVTAAIPVELTLTPSEQRDIPLGLSASYQVMLQFSDESVLNVSEEPALQWRADNPELIATFNGALNDDALDVTAIGEGETRVTASWPMEGGAPLTAEAPIRVTPPQLIPDQPLQLRSLLNEVILPPARGIPAGLTAEYRAVASFTDGPHDVTAATSWSLACQDESCPASNIENMVTANEEGSVSLLATFTSGNGEQASGQSRVNVISASLTKLEILDRCQLDAKYPHPDKPGLSCSLSDAESAPLTQGSYRQLFAIATFTDHSVFDVSDNVAWDLQSKYNYLIRKQYPHAGLDKYVMTYYFSNTNSSELGVKDDEVGASLQSLRATYPLTLTLSKELQGACSAPKISINNGKTTFHCPSKNYDEGVDQDYFKGAYGPAFLMIAEANSKQNAQLFCESRGAQLMTETHFSDLKKAINIYGDYTNSLYVQLGWPTSSLRSYPFFHPETRKIYNLSQLYSTNSSTMGPKQYLCVTEQ